MDHMHKLPHATYSTTTIELNGQYRYSTPLLDGSEAHGRGEVWENVAQLKHNNQRVSSPSWRNRKGVLKGCCNQTKVSNICFCVNADTLDPRFSRQ